MTTENWQKDWEQKFAGASGYCNPTMSEKMKSFIHDLLKKERNLALDEAAGVAENHGLKYEVETGHVLAKAIRQLKSKGSQ